MAKIVPIKKAVEFQNRLMEAVTFEELKALEKDIETHLSKKPDDFESLYVLCLVKLKIGDPGYVVEVLHPIILESKEPPLSLFFLYLRALSRLRRYDEILSIIEPLLANSEGQLRKLLMAEKIVALFNLGKFREGIVAFEQLLGKPLYKSSLKDLLSALKDVYSFVDIVTFIDMYSFAKGQVIAKELVDKYPYFKRIYDHLKKDNRFEEVIPVYEEDGEMRSLYFYVKSKKPVSPEEYTGLIREFAKLVPDEIWENPDVEWVSLRLIEDEPSIAELS